MTTTTTDASGPSSSSSSTNDVAANNRNRVTVSNVAEIFHAAGFAFKKLSELIQTMDPTNETLNSNGAADNHNYQTHWEQSDIDQFSSIVSQFTDDLNQLAENLKTKMSNRLREEHMQAKMQSLTPKQQESIQPSAVNDSATSNNATTTLATEATPTTDSLS